MVVIKIGGSLQSSNYIKKWIKSIELNFNNSFFLMFGGGKYADQVRSDQKIKGLSDYEAHILAIKAMNKLTLDNLERSKKKGRPFGRPLKNLVSLGLRKCMSAQQQLYRYQLLHGLRHCTQLLNQEIQ